jgi:hypothetical protein
MQIGSITIEQRFHGPPNSANGGYACGRIAAFIDGPAEVTLRRPPPLDTEMAVRAGPGDSVELYDGDTLIGSGRPADFTVRAMDVPTFDEAALAASRSFDASRHPLPTCFVCGPQRDIGDGLRIHPGPVDAADAEWRGILAAPWIPDANLADESGVVRPEFIWAALDCPTAYASSDQDGMRIILLGRQCVRIIRRPASLARCVITARQTGQDGRKYYAEAALSDEQGRRLAECRATWIEVSPEVQKGLPG